MPWYGYFLLAALVFAPFDALYLYVKAGRRRDARRRRENDSQDRQADGNRQDGGGKES